MVVLAGLAAMLLASCGSSGSSASTAFAGETPEQILAASRAAAAKASGVRIDGRIAQTRGPAVSLNMRLARGAAEGHVSFLAENAELVRLGDTLYLKAQPALYRRLGVTKTVPADTWLKLPKRDITGMDLFTNATQLTGALLRPTASLAKGRTTTVDGQPALELQTAGKLFKGAIFISTKGEPLPLKLEKRGAEAGRIRFSNWNQPPSIQPPAKVTDP